MLIDTFNSEAAKAIADAVFPKNAKNVLLWPRMKRTLQQMHFDEAAIKQFCTTLRVCAFVVMAEQYDNIYGKNGGLEINYTDVKCEIDEERTSGFRATHEDPRIREKQQVFIDELDFRERVREKFIQALSGHNQAGIIETRNIAEPAPVPVPVSTSTGNRRPPRLILVKIKEKELASLDASL